MEEESDWIVDYKLALLRASGVTGDALLDIDMSTVSLTVYGSDGWDSGCDTCGSGEASMSAYLYYAKVGGTVRMQHNWDGPEQVTELIKSFSER